MARSGLSNRTDALGWDGEGGSRGAVLLCRLGDMARREGGVMGWVYTGEGIFILYPGGRWERV